jgi:putative heme-binding domain-containing protein
MGITRTSIAEESAKPQAAKLVPLNYALGKPATASGSQHAHEPNFATDGDKATRWCAIANKVGHWWQVDLKKPEDLNLCRLTWEFADTHYQYKVEGSPDGKTWQLLVDATGDKAPGTQVTEHRIDAHGVRYCRVTVTGLETGKWPSFSEFEVYGKDLVDPATLVASKNAGLLREIKPTPGFEVTMFAAPPNVSYPVCLAAAPNGDVFVGCDPNGSLDQKRGRGHIIRCRDTDDDGVADQFKTFAQVDSPRGMVWDAATNTMYVQHPPMVQAYHDDDGDGVSDRVETLVEGLGFDLNFRGADHTTNGMQLGVDGWLYIACGDYGFLAAKGRDGKTLKLHGGGVVRVRPDGTRLEIVSHGQRNIYDVAISPNLDLFTRDNTNDGDGWDVRLSHVVQTGNYGYPSLFKNFNDEALQPLAIYGGGSPTGSLFLDEPGLPKEFTDTLFTCDWGRNWIYYHPMKPAGASFKAEQHGFVEMPRPIDLEVDGRSRLYAASWHGGGFNYSGPDVGYVARLTYPNASASISAMPDVKLASDAALVQLLASDSGVRRLAAQREILARGAKGDFKAALTTLVEKPGALATRVAALFTLAQLPDGATFASLEKYLKDSALREYAIRAMTDDVRLADQVPTAALVSALADKEPRVRLAAVVAIARLNKLEAADAIVPLVADADPVVAHAAVSALVTLHATKPCFQAIDDAKTSLLPGVIRALQAQHEPEVATALIDRLNRANDPSLHRLVLTALCRLAYRDADWVGGWWGTRPDTSGPYYSPEPWAETQSILAALRKSLGTADHDTLRHLVLEVVRHKLDLPEAMPKLIELSRQDLKLQATAAEFLATRPNLSADAVTLLSETAKSDKQSSELRARVLHALYGSNQPGALEAAADVLAKVADNGPADLVQTRADFLREGNLANHIDLLTKLAASNDANARELAYGVFLQLVQSKQTPGPAADAANKAIADAWAKPAQAASLLRAIGRDKVGHYRAEVNARLADPYESVKAAAAFAASQLPAEAKRNPNEKLIANLSFEQARDGALRAEGDAKLGAQLFIKQGCIACHTVSKKEPPKGPYLGGIAQRYSRTELIESILKPNAKIAQGFTTHYFITRKRDRVDGFIVRESGDETEVRGASGTSVTLKKADVAKTGTLPTSIMPEGLAANLSPSDLASLLAYLESLKAE